MYCLDQAVSDQAVPHSQPEPQDDLTCLVYDPVSILPSPSCLAPRRSKLYIRSWLPNRNAVCFPTLIDPSLQPGRHSGAAEPGQN